MERFSVWKLPSEFEFESVVLTLSGTAEDIKPGDTYLAGRNTGPHLLTCKRVDAENGWVIPVTHTYPFNLYECRKVLLIDGEPT